MPLVSVPAAAVLPWFFTDQPASGNWMASPASTVADDPVSGWPFFDAVILLVVVRSIPDATFGQSVASLLLHDSDVITAPGGFALRLSTNAAFSAEVRQSGVSGAPGAQSGSFQRILSVTFALSGGFGARRS